MHWWKEEYIYIILYIYIYIVDGRGGGGAATRQQLDIYLHAYTCTQFHARCQPGSPPAQPHGCVPNACGGPACAGCRGGRVAAAAAAFSPAARGEAAAASTADGVTVGRFVGEQEKRAGDRLSDGVTVWEHPGPRR